PAPTVEPTPAPAPPPVLYDKNGKPIPPPKNCTAKEVEKYAKKAAQSLRLADSLTGAAAKLRDASGQRVTRSRKYGTTVFTVVCCSMISESQTR
ncbi:MAG TPA: hypothetical protein VHG27_00330, partial [Xanthobacteraceae bacterium]|nr:hypothetical protein [Xanthobacteraceae bacterium]